MARTALPIILSALAAALLVAVVLVWSCLKADGISIARQESLADLVLSQVQSAVAHDQESATVWDDAVRQVQRPDAAQWIDSNLGSWMHTYFGHDSAYLLDGADRPIYAFTDGATAKASAYEQVARSVAPLIAELRGKLRNSDTSEINDRVRSPGVTDVAVIDGHPGVISIKPLVSDTGEVKQAPGSEYLHVAVRYLDGSFLSDLKRDYLFNGMRFSWTGEPSSGETSLALHSRAGLPVGYFIWQPSRPGTAVMAFMAPVLTIMLIVVAVALTFLINRLWKRSITLQASEARVQHLASHDPLTGLPNRAMFNNRLDEALAASDRRRNVAAVLYLDLDRFKQVNDTLGHPTGDELIRQFASRLLKVIRADDLIARIGGDEFTVIVAGTQEVTVVEALCNRIIQAVSQPFDIDGNHISVGVSIGVAMSPEDGTERTELTRKADIALYHAKSAGRGRFAIFGKDMDAIIQERRAIEDDLRRALKDGNGIEVFYQPLYSAQDRQVTGVEALARWRHPERGWIAPAVFIPVAEDAGLIEKLGEFVLRKACQTAAAWPIDKIAVNASAIELRNPLYAVKVANVLLSCGMNPRQLEIEVTESTLTDEAGACETNIKALRELGVRIALDDFGTGFSSMSRLQKLDVDRIKIDRSFVQGFGQSGSDEAIVQAIVALAKATGLKTTAEGVETLEQGEYLKQIGCDDIQGFLMSKPVAEDEMDRMLRGAEQRQVG